MVLCIFSIVLSSSDVDAFANPPTNRCPLFGDNTRSATGTKDKGCPCRRIHCSCSFTSLTAVYGVNDMAASAKKIYDAAAVAPEGHFVVLLAHNGPTGLGSRIDDICGRDWVPGGGDHGDPDLELAISDLQRETRVSIPLVVFGHMHKSLAYGRGVRKMIAFGANQTIYLNGAVVPRVKYAQPSSSTIPIDEQNQLEGSGVTVPTLRAFTVVDLV
ncbi:hypothetical protein PR202_ga17948 [Eleusine coracana subsp. coracana]|uniref:Calcineurin-like phosphoesterase domain-containing protein n=1 Tax=Eleusine coracana subsp. coracana TaxID=191504 RepID=A0AAV5CQR0_ELECO|nr:hypothetical protein PR202_ga17948 [Eleusine coracana subsp. coracana]